MTLRDLTTQQRERLISRGKKDWVYWEQRLKFSELKTNRDEEKDMQHRFEVAFSCGVKAVLDILLTPKDERK